MATCMLCSSWVADDQAVCPHCGGAVDGPGGHGTGASPWDDPTRVDAPAPDAQVPSGGPFGAPAPDPTWGPPAAAPPAGGWGPGGAPPSGPPTYGAPTYGAPTYGAPTYGAPGYGPAAWGTPVAFRPAPPTCGMATTAFVVSLVSVVTATFCGVTILGAPVGAVLGHLALRRIAETGEGGRGLALAGVIIGWIGTALILIGVAVLVGLVVAA